MEQHRQNLLAEGIQLGVCSKGDGIIPELKLHISSSWITGGVCLWEINQMKTKQKCCFPEIQAAEKWDELEEDPGAEMAQRWLLKAQRTLIAKITLFSTQFCPDQVLPSSCSCLWLNIFIFAVLNFEVSGGERSHFLCWVWCVRGWTVPCSARGWMFSLTLMRAIKAPNPELIDLPRATKGEAPGLLCSLSLRTGSKSASQLVPFTGKGHLSLWWERKGKKYF